MYCWLLVQIYLCYLWLLLWFKTWRCLQSSQMVSRQNIRSASRQQTQARGGWAFLGAGVGSASRWLRAVPLLQSEGLPLPSHLQRQQTEHRQQAVLLQPYRHDRGASAANFSTHVSSFISLFQWHIRAARVLWFSRGNENWAHPFVASIRCF